MLLSRERFPNFLLVFLCCLFADASRNARRSGYQSCLEGFDVHNDKIIRTQDSREMGAVYLNVSDVDSREECLRFCCEVERCDVFIFEEKKPGSCYLFQCGPLYDFKCKFTNHANYTSAVRTNYNNPNSQQVEPEVQISQQEHELKSLRKPVVSAPVEYPYTEPPKPITTPTPKLVLTTPTPRKPACSRNQYECRTSGDCIAIYNVCDGIPQCADGSDEAADLVCPTEKPTVPNSWAPGGPPSLQKQQPPVFSVLQPDVVPPIPVQQYHGVEQRKPLPPLYPRGLENDQQPWEHLPNLARQVITQQGMPYPGQVDVPQIRKNFANQRYQWDYPGFYEQNKEMYGPNAFREQNGLEEQPHIFNHKGSSVIGEPETDNSYVDTKQPYPAHFPGPNQGSWQDNQVVPFPTMTPIVQQKFSSDDVKNVTTPPPPCSVPHTDKNVLKNPPMVNNGAQKLEAPVRHEKPVNQAVVKSPSPSKTEISNINHVQLKEPKEHKSVIVIEDRPREHAHKKGVAERLQQETNTEILQPRGAVISLALGLTVTAITATLIACRLRVVKRRGRRGHGPYAHDADYLVNGMYL